MPDNETAFSYFKIGQRATNQWMIRWDWHF